MREVSSVRAFVWSVVVLAIVAATAAWADPPAVPYQSAPDLDVEDVGVQLGLCRWKLQKIMGDNSAGWMQLVWYRADNRVLHFRTVDMDADSVNTSHSTINAHEVLKDVRLDGCLYMALNIPAYLVKYDPDSDTITNLGDPFDESPSTLYSMDPNYTDHTLALGAANGSTEVATFNTQTSDVTCYGEVGQAQHGYVYYVENQTDYVYAAVRGSIPWEVWAINKTTEAKSCIWTAASLDYDVIGTYDWGFKVRYNPTSAVTYYSLSGGQATQIQEPGTQNPAPDTPVDPPDVQVDDSTDGQLTVYYLLDGETVWEDVTFSVSKESLTARRLILWDSDTVFGISGDYGPAFKYSIAGDSMSVPGLPTSMNPYAIAREGSLGYLSGYPNTAFAVFDPSESFTNPNSYPGYTGIPWDDEDANPRLISYLGSELGGNSHTGVAAFPGRDGHIWIFAMKHRYYKGMCIYKYNISTGQYSLWDDEGAFDHLNISWVCSQQGPTARSDRILITTRVEENPELESDVPTAAKVFEFHTALESIYHTWQPFANELAIGPIQYTNSCNKLIGMITRSDTNTTKIFWLHPTTGAVVKTYTYTGVVTGVPDLNGIPRHGASFTLGPEAAKDKVWTMYKSPVYVDGQYKQLLLRIDSYSLEIEPIGFVGIGAGHMVFDGDDVYFGGGNYLRRVEDVVPD